MSTYHTTLDIEAAHEVNSFPLQIDMKMVDPGLKPIRSPFPGDPGHPPEFEVVCVRIMIDGESDFHEFTETDYVRIFPSGQADIDNAHEWASQNPEAFRD